jgi:hypothetical protein
MIEEFKGSSGSSGGRSSGASTVATAAVVGAGAGYGAASMANNSNSRPSSSAVPGTAATPAALPAPPPPVITKKNIILPCIATTLGKNGEIMYLLDSSRNLVFFDAKGLFSLDVDYILNTFANERKPEDNKDRYYRNSYGNLNDCPKKEIELVTENRLQERPNASNLEKFILNEVKINGDILNKYNLTDISLNQFEGSRVFREPFNIGLSPQPPNYVKLDNNQKKRLACGLYYHFISEILTYPESLTAYLIEEKVKPGYNEKNSIAKFYTDRRKDIGKWQINVLEEFQKRDIFTYKKPVENKGLNGGQIAGIVIGVILGVVLIIFVAYKIINRSKASTTTSSSASAASASASASTTSAAPAKTGVPAKAAKAVTHVAPATAHGTHGVRPLYGSA